MKNKTNVVTKSVLQELLDYRPETGVFSWKVNRSNVKAGTVTGCKTVNGYLFIRLFKKCWLAHRLAWIYCYGHETLPPLIDHINGDKTDNRIDNLRPGTKVTNGQNRHGAQANNASSGLLGVAWLAHVEKFTAYINFDGRRKYLGLFEDKHEAHSAYLKAKRELHEGCTI